MSEDIDLEEYAPWLVALITLAGGGIRALLLATKGMGLDETVNVWLAGHSLAEMLPWIARVNQQPPLYYFLLHFWLALKGDAPYYARILSVFFGAGTLPFIYLIGKRLGGAMVGLAAAVLLAVSPFHIFFAQETSMFTLLTFNAAIALYALARLVTDPRSTRPIGSQFRDYWRVWSHPAPVEPASESNLFKKYELKKTSKWRTWISRHQWSPIQSISTDLSWAAFIFFSAATLLSHNTAILFFLTTNLFVLGLMFVQKAKKPTAQAAMLAPSLWNWAKAQVGILLLTLPWIIPYLKAGAVVQQSRLPAATPAAVLQAIKSFLNASSMIPANFATVIWVVYALVLCLGLVYFRKKLPQFLFLAVLFILPFALELIVSLWRPAFSAQTLIWTTIPLFLLLAAGVTQLRFRFAIVLMLGVLGTLNFFSISDYFRFYQKEDWNTATRTVVGRAEKGDLVLFNTNLGEIPFNYYIKPYDYLGIQLEKQGIPLDLAGSGVAAPQMTAAEVPGLSSLLAGHRRVWLVYSDASFTDPHGLIAQTLAAQMKLAESSDFYGGQVQLYVSP